MLFSTFTSQIADWLLFIFMVGGIAGLSCLGLILRARGRKRGIGGEEEKGEDIKGSVFEYLGVMYAILLGLLIIGAQGKFDDANRTVTNEAAALMVAVRDSSALPEPLRGQVQGQLEHYIELVISDDWRILSAGHQNTTVPLKASGELTKLWTIYGRDIARAPLGNNLMSNLETVSIQRAQRFAINREGVPDALWFLLGIGTIMIICLAIFFQVKSFSQHLSMIIIISIPIAIFLWLIAELENPFGGIITISPEAFEHVLQVMRQVSGH